MNLSAAVASLVPLLDQVKPRNWEGSALEWADHVWPVRGRDFGLVSNDSWPPRGESDWIDRVAYRLQCCQGYWRCGISLTGEERQSRYEQLVSDFAYTKRIADLSALRNEIESEISRSVEMMVERARLCRRIVLFPLAFSSTRQAIEAVRTGRYDSVVEVVMGNLPMWGGVPDPEYPLVLDGEGRRHIADSLEPEEYYVSLGERIDHEIEWMNVYDWSLDVAMRISSRGSWRSLGEFIVSHDLDDFALESPRGWGRLLRPVPAAFAEQLKPVYQRVLQLYENLCLVEYILGALRVGDEVPADVPDRSSVALAKFNGIRDWVEVKDGGFKWLRTNASEFGRVLYWILKMAEASGRAIGQAELRRLASEMFEHRWSDEQIKNGFKAACNTPWLEEKKTRPVAEYCWRLIESELSVG